MRLAQLHHLGPGAGGGTVPLGRRLLTARPARLAVGSLGIGLAVMLLLLLEGLWVGVQDRMTTYEENTGAQLAVVSPGTENLFADPSVLPAATATRVATTSGVVEASRIRTMYTILELHGGKAAAALVGAQPGGLGTPWALRSGRPPGDGEVTVDALFADRHGLQVGDRLEVLGRQLLIVGLTDDTAMFMTPLIFTTDATLAQALRTPDTTGAVLVATSDPLAVAERLRARGFTVHSTAELRSAALRLATRIYGAPVRLMVGVAFIAGTLTVALVAHTVVAEHDRDLGVLKAVGATPARLRRLALGQTLSLTALGSIVGMLLLLIARIVIDAWRPQFPVLVTDGSVVRAAITAIAMALLAAWLPVHRVARLDAATAFRSQP